MKLKCPYCAVLLSPPLSSVICPACGKVMNIPEKFRTKHPGDEKAKVLGSIAANAERQRASFQFQGSPRFLRQPSILFLVLVAFVMLGGVIVSVSRSPEERRPPPEKEAYTRQELRIIATALELYRNHIGHYPLASEGGLYALMENPGVPGWQGRYVSGIFRDAWGTPYHYDPDGSRGRSPSTSATERAIPNGVTEDFGYPVLFSCGPDKRPGTPDDLHAGPDDFILDPELLERWEAAPEQPSTVTILRNDTDGGIPLTTP